MKLGHEQRNRAAGVLLGQAIGDALGVPYEFTSGPKRGPAEMIGGGLGPYEPGEWSDDTQMAVCIARVAATGADLTSTPALDAIAGAFLDWQEHGASDIGNATSQVLSGARHSHSRTAEALTRVAEQVAESGRAAGNGALMRTGIVGLTRLDDRQATAQSAAAVAALTHADRRCVESAVLWSEAIRVAVVEGRLELASGLDLVPSGARHFWSEAIAQAETKDPSEFTPNGFTVTALQAAWSAIYATRNAPHGEHVSRALQQAIAIGNDTDTVAAISGSLLGARYGVSGLPTDWTRRVHGWPGLHSRDLIRLSLSTAQSGKHESWPGAGSMVSGYGRPLAVPHPADSDVVLGTEADLASCCALGITAVVSLSRVGDADIAATGVEAGKHVEVWLIDSEDPTHNADPRWTIFDAARTVHQLRAEGERVLLHCVAAEHRTPAVGLAYSRLLGVDVDQARQRIATAVGHRCGGLLWNEAASADAIAPFASSAG